MGVRKLLIIILVISVLELTVNAEENDRCANVKTPFVGFRKKRYLSFPPGTNMVALITWYLLNKIFEALNATVGIVGDTSALGFNFLADIAKHLKFIVLLSLFNRFHFYYSFFEVKITMSLLKAIMVHAPSGWNAVVELDVLFPLLSAEMTNALFGKKLHHRQKREFWEKIEYAISSYNYNGRSCIYRSICEAKRHLAPPGKSLVHDILRAIFLAPIHNPEFREEIDEVYIDLKEPEICERMHDCPISILEIVLGLNKNFT